MKANSIMLNHASGFVISDLCLHCLTMSHAYIGLYNLYRRMEFPILINWTSPFPCLRLLGGIS